MKEVVLQLTWLDIIFLVLTLASLAYNLYQHLELKKEKEKMHHPMKNGLIGLFNSIKAHDTAMYTMQVHLQKQTHSANVEESIQLILQLNKSIKESIVALLVTINPDDRTGKDVFKASEYGETDEEKEQRKKYFQKFLEDKNKNN